MPRGDPIQLGGEFSANVVKVLGWANDPAILQSNIVTVLLTEGLHDLNELVVENPHARKLRIPLPDEQEMWQYVQGLVATSLPELPAKCEVSVDVLGRRLTGLSRVGARTVLALALKNDRTITSAWLTRMKKDMIERECQGLLEFLESPFTLDNVAGLDAVKAWLREDAQLLRRGVLHALPMGYLIAGRIGTGKTFLVQCWAGELGIPCVVFKNFRDRWVGATESNLEKIFAILRALGQVVVFVDEADQAAGKREGGDGDSGLSGRVYAMLAKEMSDTRNRGKIIWVFATSRPDLLEVDLKRQGRLDVHIPLFPPQTPEEMRALLLAVARKLKFPLAERRPAGSAGGTAAGRQRDRRSPGPGPAGPRAGGRATAAPEGHPGRGLPGGPAQRLHAQAGVHGPGGGEGVHGRAVPARAVPRHPPGTARGANRRTAEVHLVMGLVEIMQSLGDRLGILEKAAETAQPTVRLKTRSITLAELMSEIRSEEVRTLAELPAELSVPFDKVFEAAGIKPRHGLDHRKAVGDPGHERIQGPGPAEVQKRILAALAAEKAEVQDLVKDAVARDKALDAFEEFAREKLRDRTAARERRLAEIEAAIGALAEGTRRLEGKDRLDRKQWGEWHRRKRAGREGNGLGDRISDRRAGDHDRRGTRAELARRALLCRFVPV